MIKFYIPHLENVYFSKYKILHYTISIIVAKICKKVFKLNISEIR